MGLDGIQVYTFIAVQKSGTNFRQLSESFGDDERKIWERFTYVDIS